MILNNLKVPKYSLEKFIETPVDHFLKNILKNKPSYPRHVLLQIAWANNCVNYLKKHYRIRRLSVDTY
jgi:hypothetical protein